MRFPFGCLTLLVLRNRILFCCRALTPDPYSQSERLMFPRLVFWCRNLMGGWLALYTFPSGLPSALYRFSSKQNCRGRRPPSVLPLVIFSFSTSAVEAKLWSATVRESSPLPLFSAFVGFPFKVVQTPPRIRRGSKIYPAWCLLEIPCAPVMSANFCRPLLCLLLDVQYCSPCL